MSGTSRSIARFVEFGKKIVCVGRNYSEHAAELGNPVPKTPILFLKPSTAYIRQGQTIQFPPDCDSLHHEVELGVVVGRPGRAVSETDALGLVAGYVVALDMTARDLQDAAKRSGQPWTLAKGFDTSCPVGDFIDKEKVGNPGDVNLWLKVNGEMKQSGNTRDMIFSVPHLISYISRFFTLEAGDLVLTGTPSGVGPVKPGDIIEAGIGEISKIKFTVGERT